MPSIFTATLVQFIVAILFFVSLLYGQRELTVLTLLVLGVIGGTRLWTRFALARLKCDLSVDKRYVFPGEQVSLTISAENAKLLPVWLAIQAPLGNLLQHTTREKAFAAASTLLWYERKQFQLEFTAEQRGVYQIGPLDIQAGDIFSFFSRYERTANSQTLITYPKRVSLKSLPLPRRDFFGDPKASSPVPDPIYILGTRDYLPGQPAKHIHWKASARHDHLQEKVFEPTVQEKVLLVVDVESFASRGAEDEFERVLEAVASLAVRFDQRGHAVGFVTNGAVKGKGSAIVPVSRNETQLARILERLARLEMKSERVMKDVLRQALSSAWGVSAVYFSYLNDETVSSANRFLTLRKIPTQFIVSERRSIANQEPLGSQPRIYELAGLWTHGVAKK